MHFLGICECYISYKIDRNAQTVGVQRLPLSGRSPSSRLSGVSTRGRKRVKNRIGLDSQKSLILPSDPGEEAASTQERLRKTISGFLIGGIIILGLAGSPDAETSDPILGAFPIATVTNVIDAAVPGSSTDIVAVSLGEAIAGIIGAVLSALLKALASDDRKPLVAEALADSDYFIAQAGLIPTLEAVGISPFFASLGGVVVASVPSQLVKLGSKEKQRMIDEEKSLA